MERYNETLTGKNSPQQPAYVLDYPKLMETAQLSVARTLNLPGSLEAHSFKEVLASHDAAEQEKIIREVGLHFDDAVVNFVTASLIARRPQQLVILAEASEGIDGILPWEDRLQAHMENLRTSGVMPNAHVSVERYSTKGETIAELTESAQALAS